MRKISLLVSVIMFFSSAPANQISGQAQNGTEVPREWIDPDTGHRIVRLSDEPGSQSLYFHQNAYTTEGDKLIITTPNGISTINLKTREIEKVVEGRVGVIVVGRKSRQVYYTKEGTVYATHLDTRATREIVKLPFRGGLSSLNADETLLLGARTEGNDQQQSGNRGQGQGQVQSQRTPGGAPDWQTQRMLGPDGKPLTFAERKEVMMNNRLEQRIPMVMYTVSTGTGEVKTIHRATDWLGHLQFSPTDPNLIMFCHEGPWHKVDRLWTIRTDGTGMTKLHTRTMNMEIAGHEFFSNDGKTIWYDLQTPRGEDFWVAGFEIATGRRTYYHLQRDEWSVHFNVSRDGALFGGDGGDSEMVAHAKNGKWIYLFRPESIPDVAGIRNPNSENLTKPGFFKSERLVNMIKHNYELEPNVTFTPDGKWIVFRSNMFGPTHVFAVEIEKSTRT
ncbi:MAG: oligogalacturonate lyase family protein [Acidobacteriota bacterium]|nr:oligogalacturonate lyase family protein [Acidobacteriota bacterium]